MFRLGGLFIPDTPTPKGGLQEEKINLPSLTIHVRLDYHSLPWKRTNSPFPKKEECRRDSREQRKLSLTNILRDHYLRSLPPKCRHSLDLQYSTDYMHMSKILSPPRQETGLGSMQLHIKDNNPFLSLRDMGMYDPFTLVCSSPALQNTRHCCHYHRHSYHFLNHCLK